jgi:hypothetical protein
MRPARRIIPSHDVREFFRDSVGEALSRQSVQAEDHTVHYVVELLAGFTRSEDFHEAGQQGARTLRPLALMLSDAVDAPTEADRDRAMRRLGDVALFVAGFFPDAFARRSVDVDYCIRMGGTAYSWLAERARYSANPAPPPAGPFISGCSARKMRLVARSRARQAPPAGPTWSQPGIQFNDDMEVRNEIQDGECFCASGLCPRRPPG